MATRLKGSQRAARSIGAGEFKAKCLALLDQVNATGEALVITKRGRPVARLVPAADAAPRSLLGSVLRERDVVSPTGERWSCDPPRAAARGRRA